VPIPHVYESVGRTPADVDDGPWREAAGTALGTVARKDGRVLPHWHRHVARPTESLLALRTATVGSLPPSLPPSPSLSLSRV
jgi:hypothetical protein